MLNKLPWPFRNFSFGPLDNMKVFLLGGSVPLINNLFEPHDAQAILQSRDKRIWAPTRNGIIRLREHIN